MQLLLLCCLARKVCGAGLTCLHDLKTNNHNRQRSERRLDGSAELARSPSRHQQASQVSCGGVSKCERRKLELSDDGLQHDILIVVRGRLCLVGDRVRLSNNTGTLTRLKAVALLPCRIKHIRRCIRLQAKPLAQ
jgi:hypothetical protein